MEKTYKTLKGLNNYLTKNGLPAIDETYDFFEKVVNNVRYTVTLNDNAYTVKTVPCTRLNSDDTSTVNTSAKKQTTTVIDENLLNMEYEKLQVRFKRDVFNRFSNAMSVRIREALKDTVLEGSHVTLALNSNLSKHIKDETKTQAKNISIYYGMKAINSALKSRFSDRDAHALELSAGTLKAFNNNISDFIKDLELKGESDFTKVESAYNDLKKALQRENVKVENEVVAFFKNGYNIKLEKNSTFVKNVIGMLARSNFAIASKNQFIKLVNEVILFEDVHNVPLKAIKKEITKNYNIDTLVDTLEKTEVYKKIDYEHLCKLLHMVLSSDDKSDSIDNNILKQRAKKIVLENNKKQRPRKK